MTKKSYFLLILCQMYNLHMYIFSNKIKIKMNNLEAAFLFLASIHVLACTNIESSAR